MPRNTLTRELFGPTFGGLRTGGFVDHVRKIEMDSRAFREQILNRRSQLEGEDLPVGSPVGLVPEAPSLFAVDYLAALAAGYVVVLLEAALPPAERENRLRQVGAAAHLADGELVPMDGPRRDRPALPADAAQIIFTSGSTGAPKAVVLQHGAITANVLGVLKWSDFGPRDSILATLPLAHCFGVNWTVLAALASGARVDAYGRFSGEFLRSSPPTRSPTIWLAVPGMVEVVMKAPDRCGLDLGQLRYCLTGGGAQNPDLQERFRRETGAPVHNGYGMTEAAAFIAAPAIGESQSPGGIGRPVCGTRVRLDSGELQVTGPSLMWGYLGQPEETTDALTPDGWLRTGDLAEIRADGEIILRGRLRTTINRGGEKVSPEVVEHELLKLDCVEAVVVVGVPDPLFGQRVHALVETPSDVPFSDVDEQNARAALAVTLPRYAVPERIVKVTALPRNATGKLLRSPALELAIREENPPEATPTKGQS